MSIQEKGKSIQFRLFMILCISTIISIFVLVFVNNVVLESYYKYSKAKTARDLAIQINNYYSREIHYDIKTDLKQIETKNYMELLIENEFSEVIYETNKSVINSVEKLKTGMKNKTILKTNDIEVKDIDNGDNSFLMLHSDLDNGYKLYIRIPITPIKETVKVSNSVLIYIGMMMVLISGLLSSIVSKKFTEPIIQLNRITKKMARLDFSEKYVSSEENDEVDRLGKNINEMSQKLETTIGQLRKNNNQLEMDIEEKSKIDEMRKQFISDVSHELKTPISLIQGYAEGLIENVNEDEESRKFYAEVITDETKKMDKMVKDLLELMKLEYQERQFNDVEFNLNELIKEEIRRETVVLEDREIRIDFKEYKNAMVFADQEFIEQVINNYFTNAIKHCENVNGEKKIVFRIRKQSEKKLRLFVFNTGKQIPEENLNKIWGRFYKSDSSRNREDGGTGIGLALVKAIMNNYGNRYGVKNLENGVEFYCDINVSDIF
ncbi:MAG: GHKL domain-containing protein [Clostridia bacterium]|nr:GHKL domain-containing protein [Clostridia bacterium]